MSINVSTCLIGTPNFLDIRVSEVFDGFGKAYLSPKAIDLAAVFVVLNLAW